MNSSSKAVGGGSVEAAVLTFPWLQSDDLPQSAVRLSFWYLVAKGNMTLTITAKAHDENPLYNTLWTRQIVEQATERGDWLYASFYFCFDVSMAIQVWAIPSSVESESDYSVLAIDDIILYKAVGKQTRVRVLLFSRSFGKTVLTENVRLN